MKFWIVVSTAVVKEPVHFVALRSHLQEIILTDFSTRCFLSAVVVTHLYYELEAGVHRIPRAYAHTFVKKKTKFDFRSSQNYPWEASPDAFSEVISDENGYGYGYRAHSCAQNSLICDASTIGICDFGPFSETYHAEIYTYLYLTKTYYQSFSYVLADSFDDM